MLSIRKLRRTFACTSGGTTGVHDVSLDVPRQGILTILGPSGAGKSTLLRILAGLESADFGEVLWNGKNLLEQRSELRPVSLLLQDAFLFPGRSVRENLALGLKLRKYPAQEIHARTTEISETLGIHHLLNALPDGLSGGERQRVSLGRALVLRPEILLLDEPLASVDPTLRSRVLQDLRRLPEEFGITVIHVTHDLSEAAEIGGSVGVLADGRLVQTGTMADVYHAPATLEVARMVGPFPIQHWRGEWISTHSRSAFRAGDLVLNFSGTPSTSVSGPQILAVRPEHVHVGRPDFATPMFHLNARIVSMRQAGWQTLVELEAGGTRFLSANHPMTDLSIASEATVFWRMSDTLWFPP